MKEQTAFNKVWKHWVVDKQPRSQIEYERCAYRGKDGGKCAIGILIPDKLYDSVLEGRGVGYLLTHFPAIRKHLNGCTLKFLLDLQNLHDDSGKWDDDIYIDLNALIALAVRRKLKVPK